MTVYGRNLPGGQPDPTAVVDGRAAGQAHRHRHRPGRPASGNRLAFSGHVPPTTAALDGFEYRVRNDAGSSNPFLLTFARAPVVLDSRANDTPETAQEVTVPCEIAGRIEKRHDRDWYTFTAKKGDVLNIELLSDRLGCADRHELLLRNPATKADIIELDDPAPTQPDAAELEILRPHRRPAAVPFAAPADGKYQRAGDQPDGRRPSSGRAATTGCASPRSSPTSAWSSCRPTTSAPTAATCCQGGNAELHRLRLSARTASTATSP